jgi:hypothetical protein
MLIALRTEVYLIFHQNMNNMSKMLEYFASVSFSRLILSIRMNSDGNIVEQNIVQTFNSLNQKFLADYLCDRLTVFIIMLETVVLVACEVCTHALYTCIHFKLQNAADAGLQAKQN